MYIYICMCIYIYIYMCCTYMLHTRLTGSRRAVATSDAKSERRPKFSRVVGGGLLRSTTELSARGFVLST